MPPRFYNFPDSLITTPHDQLPLSTAATNSLRPVKQLLTIPGTMRCCVRRARPLPCPLWVKSGHLIAACRCPLYPQKRTLLSAITMSALCHKQTSSGRPLAATSEVLLGVISQVVLRVDEFEAKRSDGRHLADVFTRFCPMKVVRVAW